MPPRPEATLPAERDRTERRALGAYYTESDVARYVCVNTLLPWLCRGLRLALPSGARPFLTPYLAAESPWPGETDLDFHLRREYAVALATSLPCGSSVTAEECVTHNLDLPALLQHWLTWSADEEQVVRLWHRLQGLRVLDPTCGDGAFLMAALRVLEPIWEAVLRRLSELGAPEEAVALGLLREQGLRRVIRGRILEQSLFGVDVEAEAVSRAGERLLAEWDSGRPLPARQVPRLNLRVGNAVAGLDWGATFPAVLESGGFDVVVGNPPYVSAHAVGYRPDGFTTGACPNVYAWVVERSLRLLSPEGRLGLILPVSAVSGPEYRSLAALYLARNCWISTYSNRPAKLFDRVEQRLAVLLTGLAGSRGPELHTSAYQHWYEGERPQLFQRLHYVPSLLHEGFPAKLGHPLAASAFRKLQQTTPMLGSCHPNPQSAIRNPQSATPTAVWLHDGPTYWVRALPFQPNVAEARASSHYQRIPVGTPEQAHALAALLSSSTFYFWFKATSNCRDLGRREWGSFPVGELDPERLERLAGLGQELAERLKSTARRRQRRYPSGSVAYEEYYPSRAVDILDRIDEELAAHYGLTPEEARYIRQLDRTYRLGRTAAS